MNTIKIILLGESGVGKSRICHSYIKSLKDFNDMSTIGVDFKFKEVKVDNMKFRVHIWDTAGQERFRSIIKNYFRNNDGNILVFDLTNRQSFIKLESWLLEINEHSDNKNVFLVGNKLDMVNLDNDYIRDHEITELISAYPNIKKYYKLSAVTRNNFDESINDIINLSIKYSQRLFEVEVDSDDENEYISFINKTQKKKGCCN